MDAEYSGWYRVGGHRLQFYATDEEIAGWLVETLPDEFGPYDIVGAEWHDGQWTPFSFPLEEIGTAVTTRRATNWWIRSQRLSPDVPPGDDHRHSFGGLILVQLGRVGNDDLSGEASIAVVDRIRNETTGEERRQPEYLRIFERLRRSMRKRLVVTTLRRFPDGSVWEHWRMTARAAEAHARGEVRFRAEPVDLIP